MPRAGSGEQSIVEIGRRVKLYSGVGVGGKERKRGVGKKHRMMEEGHSLASQTPLTHERREGTGNLETRRRERQARGAPPRVIHAFYFIYGPLGMLSGSLLALVPPGASCGPLEEGRGDRPSTPFPALAKRVPHPHLATTDAHASTQPTPLTHSHQAWPVVSLPGASPETQKE